MLRILWEMPLQFILDTRYKGVLVTENWIQGEFNNIYLHLENAICYGDAERAEKVVKMVVVCFLEMAENTVNFWKISL